MHSASFPHPPRLPACAGFRLFLGQVSSLVALWLVLWAILAASASLDKPQFAAGQIPVRSPCWLLSRSQLAQSHLNLRLAFQGER